MNYGIPYAKLIQRCKTFWATKVVHRYIKTNTMYKYYKVKAGSARSITAYLCSWKLNLTCRLHMYLQAYTYTDYGANKLNRSASLKS